MCVCVCICVYDVCFIICRVVLIYVAQTYIYAVANRDITLAEKNPVQKLQVQRPTWKQLSTVERGARARQVLFYANNSRYLNSH